MSCHILETALLKHLHRGRSSSHPSLATCLVRDGITVVRKKCSEASPLEVRVDHCSLSICPNIIDRYVEPGETFLTIIGLGLISVLLRKSEMLIVSLKHFHIHALDSWHIIWIDNCQLFLFQGMINPRKLEGGPSYKSPITQLAFHSLREIDHTELILQWSCRFWYQATSSGRRRPSWSKNEYPPSCNFWMQVARSHLLCLPLPTIDISHLNSQNFLR